MDVKKNPEHENQFKILSSPDEFRTKGLTLQFPDGFIVQLTPDDIATAFAMEAFRKRVTQ